MMKNSPHHSAARVDDEGRALPPTWRQRL
jgi:hypothetical protein